MAQASAGTATRRERQREATLREIVDAGRSLLTDPAGLSLRAVAQRMGMTAPALYRYVDNYHDLVLLIVRDIDADTAAMLREARDAQPEDDPAAQIVNTAIAFRHWALTSREEFSLVFANPNAPAHTDLDEAPEQQTGLVFTDLVMRLWHKYHFEVPSLDELDPSVVATFGDPQIPARVDEIPAEAPGMLWVFMQSWVALYGTVTLEVFGHCDTRLIQSGALFRSMLNRQAEMLGIAHELPRLLPLVDAQLHDDA